MTLRARIEQWRRSALAPRDERRRGGAIGFELADEALHLVQLGRHPAGFQLHAAASVSHRMDPETLWADRSALRERVRHALSLRRFRGRRVVAALSPPQVKLRVFDVPAGGGDEASAILELVRERFEEPLERCVVDYVPIRAHNDTSGRRAALVAVATREAVIERLETLAASGLEVDALEIAPLAVRRLLAASSGNRSNVLVIGSGALRSDLCVFWGRRLLLYREIEFGERAALESLAKSLDVSGGEARALLASYGVGGAPAAGRPGLDPMLDADIPRAVAEILRPAFEALAEQVKRAAVFTASRMRGASIDEIALRGPLARWRGADTWLSQKLGLPVRALDALECLASDGEPPPSDAYAPTAEAAVAFGLALRGLLADSDARARPAGEPSDSDSDADSKEGEAHG